MKKLDEILIGLMIRKNNAINALRERAEDEEGGLPETVIIIAIMALVAIGAVTLIGNAIKGKAEDAANVIESVTFN